MRRKTSFITGTDTGVGKTLLTALLLEHLLQSGINVLAMKPFCSGGRGDVRLLQSLQAGRLADEEMNPFYFCEPVAPLVAARNSGRCISLVEVLQKIRAVQRQCDCLLIEGAGGVMAPLGEGYAVIDVIKRLRCAVIVAVPNRLGTINHTLLSVHALRERLERKGPRQGFGVNRKQIKVVLMGQAKPDESSRTNAAVLAELLAPVPVLQIPLLRETRTAAGIKNNAKKLKKVLAQVFA